MSLDKVKEYLKQFDKDKDIIILNTSTATVELASKALGVEPDKIAKTLSFKTQDGAIIIVTSGMARIDNKKYRNTFHLKAKMLSAEEVEILIGHEIGGVCPFAIENKNVKIYLDKSLQKYDYVYPACGSKNSAIKLSCKELEDLSNSLSWVDVCKDYQNSQENCSC